MVRRNLFTRLTVVLSASLLIAACADSDDGAYVEHGESADFDPAPSLPGKEDAVTPSFDRNRIVSNAFFRDSEALDAAQIQGFLDETPYNGRRSWLALEFVGDKRVSEVIAEVAQRHTINPMMLLTRLQVEGSHISTEDRPDDFSVDRALGCGCFDGESCRSSYLGLDKQIDCAADTYERRYDGSVDGSWEWRKGHGKRSLDGVWVTPANHATAAMYAYTPWVLPSRGGNWLFWNVTKKYIAHIQDLGFENFGEEAWIGTPCAHDDDCNFVHDDESAFCYDFTDVAGETRGFCSVVCEGYCPDRQGEAPTFCIGSEVDSVGICAAKPHTVNDQCAGIPGTTIQTLDRHIGTSNAPPSQADVCAPN